MLQLRPNCEYCDKDLPPHATDARICTYEGTFFAPIVWTPSSSMSARIAVEDSARVRFGP
jgi:uncharacterized protein